MADRGLSIQDVAARTGLSVDTLRYYERIGLLDPVARAANGHRRYAASDLDWIAFLMRLRATGMPIRGMRRFAELRRLGPATVAARRALLEAHGAEVRARLRDLESHLAAIDDKIREYGTMEEPDDRNA
jgi:DNA-binding transcriptional MerR regulator